MKLFAGPKSLLYGGHSSVSAEMIPTLSWRFEFTGVGILSVHVLKLFVLVFSKQSFASERAAKII